MTALIKARDPSDYAIRSVRRASEAAILAPHGGKIESGTTEIAEAIAGDDYNFYTFEGRMSRDNFKILHVTSTHYDEKVCNDLINECTYVVAVHGLRDREGHERKDETICLGGKDTILRNAVMRALQANNFDFEQEEGKEDKLSML